MERTMNADAELTERERVLVDFIRTFMEKNGYAPSYAEISEATGTYRSTINRHLGRLRTKKVLTWQKGFARTLRFLD